MSRKLLFNLNGSNNGLFRKFLANLKGEPRIAWYPSAGDDFRDLFYLKYPEFPVVAHPPDIFLHTDYCPPTPPSSPSGFLANQILHKDDRTTVTALAIEELPRLNLPLDDHIVLSKGNRLTGHIYYLKIKVHSKSLSRIEVPLVYAFVENAAFCASLILPNHGRLSHIIHVRYGGGKGGGGKCSGTWLKNILVKTGCETFITDGSDNDQSGDRRVRDIYPALSALSADYSLKQIGEIPSDRWSGHGDVKWYIVGRANLAHRPDSSYYQASIVKPKKQPCNYGKKRTV